MQWFKTNQKKKTVSFLTGIKKVQLILGTCEGSSGCAVSLSVHLLAPLALFFLTSILPHDSSVMVTLPHKHTRGCENNMEKKQNDPQLLMY